MASSFYYRSLRKNLVWASGYRVGLAQGFGQFMLREDRFQADGATTLRGFARNSLGPVDPVAATVIGGEAVLIFGRFSRHSSRRGSSWRWRSGTQPWRSLQTLCRAAMRRSYTCMGFGEMRGLQSVAHYF